MTTDISGNSYKILVDGIGSVLEQGRDKAIIKVNSILVETYWHVGQRIVEFEQAGKIKAEYGKADSISAPNRADMESAPTVWTKQ